MCTSGGPCRRLGAAEPLGVSRSTHQVKSFRGLVRAMLGLSFGLGQSARWHGVSLSGATVPSNQHESLSA